MVMLREVFPAFLCFAAIAQALIDGLGLPKENAAVARSLAGHIVAGVASDEEIRAFEKFCASLG